jgi:hypothetical protein
MSPQTHIYLDVLSPAVAAVIKPRALCLIIASTAGLHGEWALSFNGEVVCDLLSSGL